MPLTAFLLESLMAAYCFCSILKEGFVSLHWGMLLGLGSLFNDVAFHFFLQRGPITLLAEEITDPEDKYKALGVLVLVLGLLVCLPCDELQGSSWSQDPIRVPIGPITRARARKFKEDLAVLIQEVRDQELAGRPLEDGGRELKICLSFEAGERLNSETRSTDLASDRSIVDL